MGDVIDFNSFRQRDFEPDLEPDIDELTMDGLQGYLTSLRELLVRLDEREPEDMNSEEYEAWGDAHEELEDLVDEVIERMEELCGF